MKKFLTILFASVLLGICMNANAKVDLQTCSVYYDGCNECSVFQGKIWACTERMCIHQDTPKCLKTISEATPEQKFCTDYKGEYNQEDKVCSFGKNSINASALYNSYRDFSGQIFYMGGSKYFDERTGFYDYDAVQADLDTLKFIQKNTEKLYTQYKTEVNSKIESLQATLDSQDQTKKRYIDEIGQKSVTKIDNFVEKVVKKTEKMEHIQKERYLIKYVQKVEEFRNKHIDKIENKKYRKYFMTLDYITYAFERHIAYE